MNIELGVLFQEVAAVHGYDDVVVVDRERHEIPILPTALADMGHIHRVVTTRFSDSDEFAGQALVDQEAIHQARGADASADFQSGPYVVCAHLSTASMPSIGRL